MPRLPRGIIYNNMIHYLHVIHRCNGKCQLTIFNNETLSPGKWAGEPEGVSVRYGYISADHLNGDNIAYAEQSSEGKLRIYCAGISISATVVNVRDQACVHLWIFQADATKLPGHHKVNEFEVFSVEVKFQLKRRYFNGLHKALSLLQEQTMKRLVPSFLPDTSESQKTNKLHIDEEFKERLFLDKSQMKALYSIVYSQPGPPTIVVGSFGTGKTRLLARAAYQILKCNAKARVLICAHHQPSADTFLKNYFGPMVIENKWRKRIARMIISQKDRQDDQLSKFRCTAYELKAKMADVIVTTFGNVLHLHDKVEPGYFTHILMDEGAQTREPESPLWLCGPKTSIVIAGDHKQVLIII